MSLPSAEKQAILDALPERRPGSQARVVCPRCEGGTSKEACMSIWVDSGSPHILWARCYRTKCSLGTAKVIVGGGSWAHTAEGKYRTPPRRYMYPSYPLSPQIAAVLAEDYRIDVGHQSGAGIRQTADGRILLPIRDHLGECYGEVVKQLKPYTDHHPKAVSYFDPDKWEGGSFHSWHGGAVVLVEDQLSALRLAQTEQVVSVALLGTNVAPQLVRLLTGTWPDLPVTVALDADATGHAIHIAQKLNGLVPVRVSRLVEDVKDMDDESFLNFLTEVLSN